MDGASWSNPQETMKQFKLRKRKRKERLSDESGTLRNESTTSLDWDDTSARPPFFPSKEPSPCISSRHDMSRLSVGGQSSQSISDLYPVDFSHLLNPRLSTSTPKADSKRKPEVRTRSAETVPVDLRLGTKIRVTMNRPFPWMSASGASAEQGSVPITDEDIDLAMRMGACELIGAGPDADFSPMAILHAASGYHQFPCIYGVPLFPRLESLRRSTMSGLINLQAFGTGFLEVINNEWKESITNLFALWRGGRRHTFYSLSPTFTVLFTHLKGNSERRIVVTPTTSGFRQTLRDKGVKYSLPLKQGLLFVDLDRDDCPKDFQPPEEDQTVDLDHDEWLRDIGISPRRTLKLHRASALDNSDNGSFSTNQKAVINLFGGNNPNKSDDEDSQESSRTTILIGEDEANIDAFFRYYVESRVGSTRYGPHNGLPSTLLSSSPFHRSTLRHLKLSSRVAHREGEVKYVLELADGPILPHVSEVLMKFVNQIALQREGVKEGRLKVQVNGRPNYSGINEAVEIDDEGGGPVNLFEFEFDLASGRYAW